MIPIEQLHPALRIPMQRPKLRQAVEDHLADRNLPQVEAAYLEHLDRTPDDPAVLFFLGSLYMQKHQNGLATALLVRCIQLRPDIPEAFNNLGTAQKALGFYEAAEAAYRQAIRMQPKEADFLNNLATININNGTPEEAERLCREVLRLKPDQAQAQWNLSLALLEQGKLAEGFDLYDWGFQTNGRWNRQYNCSDWDGQPVRRLVAYGEQGVGDEVMYLSMIEDLLPFVEDELIIDCHPRLAGLIARTWGERTAPKVTVFPTRKDQAILWMGDYFRPGTDRRIDAKIALGSLPRHLRRDPSAFPERAYLTVPEDAVRYVRNKLEQKHHLDFSRPIVGLSWRGGTLKTNQSDRCIPLGHLLPVLNTGVQFLSLQYTGRFDDQPAEAEIATLTRAYPNIRMVHDQEVIDNLELHAAALRGLDHTYSVCNTTVHLGGAVGAQVTCLTPIKRAWRYCGHPDPNRMLWYGPHVRLLHQQERGQWLEVIQRIAQEVADNTRPAGPENGDD